MKRVFFAAAGLMGGALWFAPACSTDLGIDLSGIPDGGFPDGQFPDGQMLPTGPGGVGAACDATNVCRPGLNCTDGKCAPGRATPIGGACQMSAECNNGHCVKADPNAQAGACVAAGAGDAGAQCKADVDCKAGLRCNINGLDTACAPEGNVDLFGPCATSAECFGGLICIQNPTSDSGATQCLPAPGGLIDLPKPFAVSCEAETGDVQSYFDVPRGAPLADFFRLPFPNDIRTANGKPDYKDFPTPGVSPILKFDAVDAWARHIEKTGTGFSSYSSVTFRFSGEVDFDSLDKQTHYVDLTDKQEIGHGWGATSGRTNYVCPNAMTFRPPIGQPLKPGHTYGVYLTTNIKAKDKTTPVKRGTDFAAMLGASDPGGALATAYAKYKPFRDYLSGATISPDTVLNAAVFTVGQVDQPGRQLGAVEAATAGTWTKCEAGTQSPCSQKDEGRNCPAQPAADVDEYHTLITLPNYQKGTLPYLLPADDGTFTPGTKQGTLQVCASLTIKKNAQGELPVVVYAHGTGGSFRSHVSRVAGRMAALGPNGVAVLGIDQVAHGTRRGASTAEPSGIFFNFANPAAAQGNVLQGAADQVALIKFAQTGPTIATGVTLSKTQIAFWGHSQGATEGAISLPYAKGVKGVLLSGEGGSLIDSLLTKTSPTNILALAPFIISENPANVDSSHPVLTLFQNGIDIADPMNHARNINSATGTPAEVEQKHVFVPYGQKDTYATPITQRVYITAANLFVAPTPAGVTPDELHRGPEAASVSANSNGFTAVTRQYAKPANDDGHFVATQDPAAIADGDKFMKAVLIDNVAPSIP